MKRIEQKSRLEGQIKSAEKRLAELQQNIYAFQNISSNFAYIERSIKSAVDYAKQAEEHLKNVKGEP